MAPPDLKIIADHLSVVFVCPANELSGDQFYLTTGPLGMTFFEAPTPGPLEPWRRALERYLKSLNVPTTSVQGLLRLDRWAVPGVQRMASHVTCAVNLDGDNKERLSRVSFTI